MNGERASFKDWLATIGGILGAFTAILDIQITNSSLAEHRRRDRRFARARQLDFDRISDGGIVVIPLTGWLGAIFGLRRYLSVNTILSSFFQLPALYRHP